VSDFEAVIGLEVHVHLATRTKLFCACAVGYGEEPNRRTCPVCLALPGALPVLCERAVELALRAALATHCKVEPRSVYARKNYFYPDLPKGYQISQYEEPLARGGWLEIQAGPSAPPRRIGITRIHMEEDAGKSIHDGGAGTRVDLNRAGLPLIEVVSEPDLRSPEEAGAYLRALHAILRYVEASDADLEKGHFRCDANVSIRPRGETALATRTELKNLNSFRAVEGAVRAEIRRQEALVREGESVQQATLRYDLETERTSVMRLKENADDYRYFPDPDLVPLVLDPARIEAVRASLPELPEARRARFAAEYALSEYDARLLTATRPLADFFEAAARAAGAPKAVANFLLRDVLAALRERGAEIEATALAPEAVARLVRLVDAGRVTPASARELLAELLERGGDPEALVRERGLEAVSDAGALDALVAEVIAEQPEAASKFRAGDQRSLHFLIGQVMRKTRGKADAKRARERLLARLADG
jgi:aspartyl-tRNA(Asn)/glutamyl-tRNA(Gln) amidotransferase subunit B